MSAHQLFAQRKFLPLFVTQFLSAFNDNVFKNALSVLIMYRLAEEINVSGSLLVTVAAALFIAPFLLFSAIAGQLADKYEKSKLAIGIKVFEVILIGIGILGFFRNNLYLLMLVIFLLGTHSTFFGPIKYAILPQHLQEKELLLGNGFIEAGTFLAILIGSIFGGLFILTNHGLISVSVLMLSVALIGLIASLFIPRAESFEPDLKINHHFLAQTCAMLKNTAKSKTIFLSMLGISWFWLIGIVFITQLSAFSKNDLGVDQQVYTLFLTTFSLGIGVGSLLCSRLLKGKIQVTYIPLAMTGMTLFMVDLFLTSRGIALPNPAHLINITQFLKTLHGWHLLFDLFAISVFGGFYTVPLYALLQIRSEANVRSRTIASNNLWNALFMVIGTLFPMAMLLLHFTAAQVILVVGIGNAFVTIFIYRLLPYELIKSLLACILKPIYRVKVHGLENFERAGDQVLIVANHISFIDPFLIAAILPEKITFGVNTVLANKWWAKRLLPALDLYPIDPTNPMATKTLINLIRRGKKCVLFPEGRITTTGALMKMYEGPGMVASKSGAKILPICIVGSQYTSFSRLKGKVKLRWFPKITITILEPRLLSELSGLNGREKRKYESLALYDLMSEMMFKSAKQAVTLFQSLLDASKIYGKKHKIIEDIQRKTINYQQFIAGCFVLGKMIAKKTSMDGCVGILLPNSISAVTTFFGLQAFGRVPVMLDPTMPHLALFTACQTAGLKNIYTEQAFIQSANLSHLIEYFTQVGIHIHYLEAVHARISWLNKFQGSLASKFPNLYYQKIHRWNKKALTTNAQQTAAILVTFDAETPKLAMFSHLNLQATCDQFTSRIDFCATDILFNALPICHAFGLISGVLLPLFSGVKIFLYPSPLRYKMIPEYIYDTNATILFSTDTSLAEYAKYAHPYDFYSIRYVFSGTEKLKPETQQLWMEQFGKKIFEGYGATDISPFLSLNTPMHHKKGTVGRLLPGIQYRLESVPGISMGQKLIVSGPNIQLGDCNASVMQEHDTGDIVTMDEEKYITLVGRDE